MNKGNLKLLMASPPLLIGRSKETVSMLFEVTRNKTPVGPSLVWYGLSELGVENVGIPEPCELLALTRTK